MTVFGIDPGYATVGYGVAEKSGTGYRYIAHGAVTTAAQTDFPERLLLVYDGISELLLEYKPDAVSIEKLFFNTNNKTAIDVAQARGVIMLAIRKLNLPVYEYTPLQVKTSITGYGRAVKTQVQEMTARLLKLKTVPRPDDAADALALAICHGNMAGIVSMNRFISGKK